MHVKGEKIRWWKYFQSAREKVAKLIKIFSWKRWHGVNEASDLFSIKKSIRKIMWKEGVHTKILKNLSEREKKKKIAGQALQRVARQHWWMTHFRFQCVTLPSSKNPGKNRGVKEKDTVSNVPTIDNVDQIVNLIKQPRFCDHARATWAGLEESLVVDIAGGWLDLSIFYRIARPVY